MLSFNSYREKTVLKNPLNKFREETQEVEYRQDPLTGAWTRINLDRARRPHQAASKPAKIPIKGPCLFCKKNIADGTPKFSVAIVPEGRITAGEFVLFPNLFPFAVHHAVGVLTEKHDAGLDEITPEMWANALTGTIDWFRRVHKSDTRMRFASINMNYMMPAAASVVHPHMQATVDRFPTNGVDALYRKSWDFFDRTKTNFWEEYAAKDDERFIFQTGNTSWHASFAPRAANEVIGIISGKSGFFDMTRESVAEIAVGISKALTALWKEGMRSCNISIIASPLNENLSHFFNMHIVIVSRPEPKKFYTTDRGFMEVLHRETVVSYLPEELAQNMRKVVSDAAGQ